MYIIINTPFPLLFVHKNPIKSHRKTSICLHPRRAGKLKKKKYIEYTPSMHKLKGLLILSSSST